MNVTPIFIPVDSEAIIAEIIADYEDRTGKSLQPGQPERLLINTFAYREKMLREQVQAAALQGLIDFSAAPALDYLVALVGVTRLSASAARCTLEFSLAAGHSGIVIPSGTRVATTDGQVNFAIQENVPVAIGTNTVSVTAIASVTGVSGNNYATGTVTKILDPWPFVEAATNTDTTSGGANAETDEELRGRAKLAPAQFSVAGPTDAYIFFAKSASPSIIDVAVISPTPGTVEVYPMVAGGISTPTSIIQLVSEALNSKKVRPLTDTVNVLSPSFTNYDISVEVVIYSDADPVEVNAAITAALNNYKDQRGATMGGDIKTDQIKALSVYDTEKVFEVNILLPAADIVVSETEVAICDSVTVNITGTSNG